MAWVVRDTPLLGVRGAAVVALFFARMLDAQQPESGVAPLSALCVSDATAGSASERTLLIASLLGSERSSSALRPLTEAEEQAVADSLGQQLEAAPQRHCDSIWRAPSIHAWYNTSMARPDRDGAVWQGKGLTMSVTAGFTVQRGLIAGAIRPLALFSQDGAYTPYPAPRGSADFRDPSWGSLIDLPYRFGSRQYRRIEPGESYIRAGNHRAVVGLTTQSQQWGPTNFYPLVLGTEGAGYPRIFSEMRAMPIGIGQLTGQWQMGLLEASGQSQLPTGERSRIASAAMASFTPRGMPGLELGGTRFFHVRRDAGSLSWSTATLPFSGILKNQSRDVVVGGFNQLASAFFRVAPAGAGVEVYGELLREDHNVDLRDLTGEPDHASAFTVGVRRAWKTNGGITAFTLEHANGRLSHLTRVRGQSPVYIHSSIREGHTFRGQPLASSAVLAGQGTVISWNRIAVRRSFHGTVEIRSTAQDGEGGTWMGRQSGTYILELGEQRVHKGKALGANFELRRGYGRDGRTNVSFGLSWYN